MSGITDDPKDPGLRNIRPDGQQEKYLVISDEERGKGFVRPVRHTYRHVACGTTTTMGQAIAETYARNPKFYGGTYCVNCGKHFRLIDPNGTPQFFWDDGEVVGSCGPKVKFKVNGEAFEADPVMRGWDLMALTAADPCYTLHRESPDELDPPELKGEDFIFIKNGDEFVTTPPGSSGSWPGGGR